MNSEETFQPRNLIHFLVANAASSLGTGMAMIAGKLFIQEATGSNSSVGVLGAVGFAAGILAMGRLGILIDGYDRRWVMIGADSYRMLLALVVPLAFFTGVFEPWVLYTVVFLMGFGHTVGYPNLSAMIPEIVPESKRHWVNGVSETCMQVGMMSGAALSGWIYRAGGVQLVYLVDAGTYLFSALAFWTMPAFASRTRPRMTSASEAFREGYLYLKQNREVAVYGVAITLPWVATMAFNTVLPGYVNRVLHYDSLGVGLIDAAYSCGGILAGFFGGWMYSRFGPSRSMLATLTLSFLAVVTLAPQSGIGPVVPLAFLFGFGNSCFRVQHRTFVQRKVPDYVLGRVLSFFAWAGISFSAIGMLSVGRSMDVFGERSGIYFLGLFQIVGLGLVYVLDRDGFFAAEAPSGKDPKTLSSIEVESPESPGEPPNPGQAPEPTG